MKHYYPDVPGIGNVAVSRHAQDRLAGDGISEREFEAVLLRGDSVPEGQDILWRQKDGIRLVILLKPEPFRGATLVKTAYRIEPQAKATSEESSKTMGPAIGFCTKPLTRPKCVTRCSLLRIYATPMHARPGAIFDTRL